MTNVQLLEIILTIGALSCTMALKVHACRMAKRLRRAKEMVIALNEDLALRREHAAKAIMALAQLDSDGCPAEERYDVCVQELTLHTLQGGVPQLSWEELEKAIDA